MAKSKELKAVQEAVRQALSKRILDGFEVLEDKSGSRFFIGQINVQTAPEATIQLYEDPETGTVVYQSVIAYEDGPEFFRGYLDADSAWMVGVQDDKVSPGKAKKLADDLLDELFDIRRESWYTTDWIPSIKQRRQQSLREDGKYRGTVVPLRYRRSRYSKRRRPNPAKEQAVGGLLLAGLLGYAVAKRSR